MNISICHSNGIGPAGPDPAYTISMLINVVFRFLSARKNPENHVRRLPYVSRQPTRLYLNKYMKRLVTNRHSSFHLSHGR